MELLVATRWTKILPDLWIHWNDKCWKWEIQSKQESVIALKESRARDPLDSTLITWRQSLSTTTHIHPLVRAMDRLKWTAIASPSTGPGRPTNHFFPYQIQPDALLLATILTQNSYEWAGNDASTLALTKSLYTLMSMVPHHVPPDCEVSMLAA